MDSERLQACEKLLSQAYLSYVRHEEGRREPFNLFTVLRSESDEVRLHSRFLAALLDHRKAPDASRENLKHFLEIVAERGILAYVDPNSERATRAKESFRETVAKAGGCQDDNIRIERESDDIDILIVNRGEPGWAFVIENKIWAGDQSGQLQKYHKILTDRGYQDKHIHLLYLTPHGHEPTKESAGKLDVVCVSYEQTLPSWLEGCRQRACDEPELRESITQYLHLARKLTGTDRGKEYMNELKDLLLKENNLVLAHDLSEAKYEARAHLVRELWKEIENAIKEIKGFPPKSDEEPKISLDAVRGYVESWRYYSRLGLSYRISPDVAFGSNDARLCAEVLGYMDQITIGLKFIGKKDDDDKQVEGLLGKLRSGSIKSNVERHEKDTWLWWRCIDNGWGLRRNPADADHLRTLLCEDKRKKVASDVASGLKEAWDAISA